MSDDIIRLIFLGLAGVTLPAGYVAVCVWLRRQRAWKFLYAAYFILFGTAGGWALAFGMAPSGIAAASVVWLSSVALVACLISAIVVTLRKDKTRAEWIAMVGAYLYPIGIGSFIAFAMLQTP